MTLHSAGACPEALQGRLPAPSASECPSGEMALNKHTAPLGENHRANAASREQRSNSGEFRKL